MENNSYKMPAYAYVFEPVYKCPCGYTFQQRDGDSIRKMNMVKRLHKKKCEIAQEREVVHVTNLSTLTKDESKEQQQKETRKALNLE